MRIVSVLFFMLFLVACGGGTTMPVQDADPVGVWLASTGVRLVIVADGADYKIDAPFDLVDLRLVMDGNSFEATGSETTYGGEERTNYLITGTINGDNMTGNDKTTVTDLGSGDVEVVNTPFTAVRSVQ